MRRLRTWWSGYSGIERKLWLRWVAATSLGLGLGSSMAEIASSLVAGESEIGNLLSPRWQIPVAFCLGAPALAAQYLVLRRYVPKARWWIGITTLGAAFGAVVGPWAGYAAAMFFIVIAGFGLALIQQEFVLAMIFYLMFVVAGGAAGAVIGSIMGALLRAVRPQEWTREWTGPLAGAWAATGAIFWAALPLPAAIPSMRTNFGDGILDAIATPASILLTGVIGVIAGAAGGAISGRHFVRTAMAPSPASEVAAPVMGDG